MPTNTKQQLCIKPTGFLVEIKLKMARCNVNGRGHRLFYRAFRKSFDFGTTMTPDFET